MKPGFWFSLRKIGEWIIDRPFRVGTVIRKRYQVTRSLGMGSYGISYLCRDTETGNLVVLKQVRPSRKKGSKGAPVYEYETTLLASLDHPRIPKLLERFTHRGHLFFAMEYMDGRNLEEKIFQDGLTFPEKDALIRIRELLDIVEHLHEKRIVHRDVRIPNVILAADGKLRLIDFGLARRLGDRPTQVAEDLTEYALVKRIKRDVSFKSDFYALGHFLLFLLYSTYQAEEGQEEQSWEEELDLTAPTRRMLRKLLQADEPYQTASELRLDLNDAIRTAEEAEKNKASC